MSDPELIVRGTASAALWRNAAQLDGLRTASIGRFRCETAEDGAALLEDAVARLAGEGFAAAVGPMEGDTWGPYRLVTESDGRPPFLMEPANPPFYVDALTAAGFTPIAHYASAARPLADEPEPPSLDDMRVRPFDPARAETELAALHALSLQAFAANPFYRPIARDAFLDSYRPVLGLLDPDLVLLAESAEGLQGFLFGVPNYAEGRAPRAVILKTYASRRKGLGSALAKVFHRQAQAKGYATAIHALMHVDNLSAAHSEKLGATIFRRYALFGRRL